SPLPQPPPSSTPSPYTTLFRSKTHQAFTRRGAGKTGSGKGTWLGINQTKHIAEAVGNHHPQLNTQMVSKGLRQFQFVTGRAAAVFIKGGRTVAGNHGDLTLHTHHFQLARAHAAGQN